MNVGTALKNARATWWGCLSIPGLVKNGMALTKFLPLLILPFLCLSGQDESSHVRRDYVPEGDLHKQHGILSMEHCETTCANTKRCKAYAFEISESSCYFYWEVYMGGTSSTRPAGVGTYRAGLAIIPTKGFLAAFKRSSFPTRPR